MTTPRRPNQFEQEPFMLRYDNAALTADTTVKLFLVPDGKRLRIDRVTYHNITGLVADASNYFNIKVQKGDTPAVIANWSTETGEEGSIAADTTVALTMSTDASDPVIVGGAADGDDELNVMFDETGTATLPVGTITIEGHWV